MKICLGGTFNTVHKGHEVLLKAAFSLDGDVLIGLTSDDFATKKNVLPFIDRKANLVKFLAQRGWQAEIVSLNNIYGPAIEPDFEVIVVSEETLENAYLINLRRTEQGLHNLKIVVVPILKNEKGEKISSSG